ncbi:hypothetical protein [Cellulophaga sp. Ld12]|uniref:hypothetical protein n=1 Tax=Cellulophaga sp. Ld12 TaxID=3229535 RepID=UPI00386B3C08
MKKYIVSLIVFATLFTSCETEEQNTKLLTETEMSSEFEGHYNEEHQSMIPFNHQIDWTNSIKIHSNDLNTETYQFDVIWSDEINPDAQLLSRRAKNSNVSEYNVGYKLLATKTNENINFYALKFVNYSDNLEEFSLDQMELFDGVYTITNLNLDEIIMKRIKNGTAYYINDNNALKNRNITDRTVCETKLFKVQTTYYNMREGGPEVNFRTIEYIQKEVCTESGGSLGGPSNGEGGSGGGSGNSGGPNHNNDSFEDIIFVDEIIVESYPSCESFVYSNFSNTGTQVAAVSGIYEMVYRANNECLGAGFANALGAMYFSMPSYITPSAAARKSADALEYAFIDLQLWYQNTSCTNAANKTLLRQKFVQFIKDNFIEAGGQMTTTPPNGWNGHIEPFQEAFTGRDFCN